MRLEISIAALEAIHAAARASADEVCGLLLGRGTCVARVVACGNVAADPARFFEIDPGALLAAHRAARAGAPRVIGHYHSHPSGAPRPSPRDAAAAAPDGSIWLIVAGGVATAWRAVDAGALHGRFDPLPLHLVASACMAESQRPQGAAPPVEDHQ